MTQTPQRSVPLFTLDGVHDADVSTHFITTGDLLGISAFRFLREPSDDVVLLIHGLTTSTDMFVMPEHYNLVDYLLDHGYTDVWSLDFRMSNRHSYNMRRHSYTMDDVALYDFPAALEEIRTHIGDRRLHVISHCLGAVSFMMSLFGGAVTGVTSAIANSVALTPRVPRWSKLKLTSAPWMVETLLSVPYLDPRASEDPGHTRGRMLSAAVSKFHRECDVPACHMLSMMWGTGWPALYEHDNLHPVTHARGGDLYGPTSMNYYRHVRKMVKANNTAVKYDPQDPRYDALPDNYFQNAREIETPVLFMTGAENKVFTDSNIECHRRLERLVPGRHQLHVFPGYGHQDPFMGKHNDRDIFPRLVEFLDENRGGK
jgi:cholesterol oxidase